jgi:hypothetical protein
MSGIITQFKHIKEEARSSCKRNLVHRYETLSNWLFQLSKNEQIALDLYGPIFIINDELKRSERVWPSWIRQLGRDRFIRLIIAPFNTHLDHDSYFYFF